MSKNYNFSNNWFDVAKPSWTQLFQHFSPRRILEIGSYEGASACFIIDTLGNRHALEIHCIDSWEGGQEHKGIEMHEVEERFHENIQSSIDGIDHPVDLHVHKGRSDILLSNLFSSGKQDYFDFIYIDGSHRAVDVIFDALLSYRLARVGGILVFDDYLWFQMVADKIDVLESPKIAIDAFTNIYCRQLRIINAPLYQIMLVKSS